MNDRIEVKHLLLTVAIVYLLMAGWFYETWNQGKGKHSVSIWGAMLWPARYFHLRQRPRKTAIGATNPQTQATAATPATTQPVVSGAGDGLASAPPQGGPPLIR